MLNRESVRDAALGAGVVLLAWTWLSTLGSMVDAIERDLYSAVARTLVSSVWERSVVALPMAMLTVAAAACGQRRVVPALGALAGCLSLGARLIPIVAPACVLAGYAVAAALVIAVNRRDGVVREDLQLAVLVSATLECVSCGLLGGGFSGGAHERMVEPVVSLLGLSPLLSSANTAAWALLASLLARDSSPDNKRSSVIRMVLAIGVLGHLLVPVSVAIVQDRAFAGLPYSGVRCSRLSCADHQVLGRMVSCEFDFRVPLSTVEVYALSWRTVCDAERGESNVEEVSGRERVP